MTQNYSLYDYLGTAAGKELGELVQKCSVIMKVPSFYRKISNPKYEEYVNTYPKEFLDEFFTMMNLITSYNEKKLNKEKTKISEINTELLSVENLMNGIFDKDWNDMWKSFDDMFVVINKNKK